MHEIARGMQQFARTEDPKIGPVHPVRELVWLSRRAVQEDKALSNSDYQGRIADTKLYLQRLREIGSIFAEIFVFNEYSWKPPSERPRIIDLGSDIGGFSVLYWKSLAPKARVTLVEANPSTATVVAENIKRKGLQDVEVINAAVSEYDGQIELHLSGYNPSNFVGERAGLDDSLHRTIWVPTIKPSGLIGDERIDLLKMDIEGAEGGAFRELEDSGKLRQVDLIMMEFHNDPANPKNSLVEFLQILEKANFSIENVHRSGMSRARKRRPESVDIYSVRPSDRILFALTARRNKK